jgi:extradiol dioxygenase family protein
LTQALEAMYRRLRADPEGHPAQLPTYERFKRTVGEHKTLTVRDVWGKMLSVVKGK